MLNTKNLIINDRDIPSYWVFQHYLNLPETLTGQNIKIKSIFNPNEKTPSFCIYVDKNIQQYKFKDFSTGKSGNKIDLIKILFDLEYPYALMKMINDYNKDIKTSDFKKIEFSPKSNWEVDFIKPRLWSEADSKFWLSFRIGMTMLTEYNVKPIEYYTLIKEDTDDIKSLKIEGKAIYAYFDKDDELYKIYRPESGKYKFNKVKPYLQGYDQLKFNQPYLVICSSLKDAMCLKGMGYNIEVVAPDSENVMIKQYIIDHLKKKYKKIITLFDNDKAGLEAVEKYNKIYNLDGFVINLSKDISDAMKEHGFDAVHQHLKPLLKETLKK
tara:strand:+ start:11575 stop:12552 length:978 start_codon:yes stop_codon:yes gene_type:complete